MHPAKNMLLALSVVLFTWAYGAARAEPPQAGDSRQQTRSEDAFLIVSSHPPGALVRVDGQPAGLTPLALRLERNRTYLIDVSKAGYPRRHAKIKIRSRHERLDIRLEKPPDSSNRPEHPASKIPARQPASGGPGRNREQPNAVAGKFAPGKLLDIAPTFHIGFGSGFEVFAFGEVFFTILNLELGAGLTLGKHAVLDVDLAARWMAITMEIQSALSLLWFPADKDGFYLRVGTGYFYQRGCIDCGDDVKKSTQGVKFLTGVGWCWRSGFCLGFDIGGNLPVERAMGVAVYGNIGIGVAFRFDVAAAYQ